MTRDTRINDEDAAAEPWERTLLQAVRGVRYGSVEVVIHEGRVVQVETREKVRFEEADRRPPVHRGRTMETEERTHRPTGGSGQARDEETAR